MPILARRLSALAVLTMLLAALTLGAPVAHAELLRYELDPVHSRVLFSVSHDGYSNALGTFSRPRGELWFDPADWSRARLDVQLDLATLDLGDADFNARIAQADYLDSQRWPQARFVSERVEPLPGQQAQVHGILHLRGQQVPLTLHVRLNRIGRGLYTRLRQSAGFSASARLRRSDFGMRAHARHVGDEVELRIEAEARRARP